jgi:chemotaxis protein CheX
MYFNETDIRQVTQTVWDLVLKMAAERGTQHTVPRVTEGVISGTVRVSGSWNGSVTLYCFSDLAEEAASVMFGAPATELAREDVFDAVGELANIIGGNVRALLPEPCQLSLPTVRRGGFDPQGNPVLYELGFTSQGRSFWVVLTESPTG